MPKTAIAIPPFPDKERLFLLGPGHIAAELLRRGGDALLYDEKCASFKKGCDAAIKAIRDFAPDVIGVSLISSHNIIYSYEFAAELKREFPGVPLVAGGLHATLLPGEVLERGFDCAVMGDGEYAFADLVERLARGDGFAGAPGVSYLDGDGLRPAEPAFISDLDSLDYPINRIHTGHTRGAAPKLLLMLSRGCFRSCSFCVERRLNRGGRYRSPAAAMEEISDAVRKRGVRELHFVDSSILERRKLVEELCERMIGEWGADVPLWRCLARVDHFDREILSLMQRAGCRDIYSGMESANQDTLDGIRKGIKTEENERAAELCAEAGINLHGYFMAGLPWEGPEHYRRDADFVRRRGGSMDFMFSIPVPYPRTELYEKYHEEYGFTDWWLTERLVPLAEAGRPLYRWMRSRDPVLERDFFRYSREDRHALEELLLQNRRGAEEHFQRGLVSRIIWAVLYTMSLALFAVSPRLEHAIMEPLFRKIVERGEA